MCTSTKNTLLLPKNLLFLVTSMHHNWTNKLLNTNKDHDLHPPKPSTLTNTCQHSLWIRGPTKVAWIQHKDYGSQPCKTWCKTPSHLVTSTSFTITESYNQIPQHRTVEPKNTPLAPNPIQAWQTKDQMHKNTQPQPQPQGKWCTTTNPQCSTSLKADDLPT